MEIKSLSKPPTQGGNITVTGLFYTPISILVNNVASSILFLNSSLVIASVIAGAGVSHSLVVYCGSGVCLKSSQISWSYLFN